MSRRRNQLHRSKSENEAILSSDEVEIAVSRLLKSTPFQEVPEWMKRVEAVLIPTPGYERSYTEMQAELEAAGVPVPPGIRLLAFDEQNEGLLTDGPFRPRLND